MRKQITQQLMNSWEWLDEFCVSQRADGELACGLHAVNVVKIDNYQEIRKELGDENAGLMLNELQEILKSYAGEDTIIARYSEDTFAVILHFLASKEEIDATLEEIRTVIEEAELGVDVPVTVSIGGAVCHHDQEEGYRCALVLAMEALADAMKEGNTVTVSHAE